MNERARVDIPDHAPHVLVVDDDRRLRELLSRFLAQSGYRVTTAASAAEARAKSAHLWLTTHRGAVAAAAAVVLALGAAIGVSL